MTAERRLTAQEARELFASPKGAPSKYGAVAACVDNLWFASRAEARRYSELKLLERAGEISRLLLQPRYPLVVDGVKIGEYRADFSYLDKTGAVVVVDVKGVETPVFKIKRRLFEALYKISITLERAR